LRDSIDDLENYITIYLKSILNAWNQQQVSQGSAELFTKGNDAEC